MLLKGSDDPEKALISPYDAMIQTMQACLIAKNFKESQELRDKWDRIYSVTAFYVGFSDDLGPYEYIEVMDYVFGGGFDIEDLTEKSIGEIKAKLAEYKSPQIYGGTGGETEACILTPPFNPEQIDECLEATKGFRLMGQRFIPDSYMFTNLVASEYIGDKNCNGIFTCVFTDFGPIRGFPRGLDAMALLGLKGPKKS